MLTTRVLTSFAAAVALALAPASSSARTDPDREGKPHPNRCYQLNRSSPVSHA